MSARTETAARSLFWLLATMAVMSIVPITMQFVVDSIRPASYWATYFDVQAVDSTINPENEPLQMQSTAMIDRPVRLFHHDVLKCRALADSGNRFVSQAKVEVKYDVVTAIGAAPVDDPLITRESGLWEYGGRLPRSPSICNMISSPQVRPSWGVVKELPQLRSDDIVITPAVD